MSRIRIYNIALLLAFLPLILGQEYAGYDGWRNNLGHSDWGSVDSTFLRRLPNSYSDGVGQLVTTRPNPRDISQAVMKGNSGLGSYLNRTALLVYFGEHIVQEIINAQTPGCPTEYINIPVPRCDELYDVGCTGQKQIPLTRNRYDRVSGQAPGSARRMLNEITPWIDGSAIYGTSKAWADSLRSFQGGQLKATPDGRFPAYNDIGLPYANPPPPTDHAFKDVNRFFGLGNTLGNEHPMLLTMGILWFRNHNWHASQLQLQFPNWTDDQLYNRARQFNVAEYQHLVLNRWLPAWLNATVPVYAGFNPNIDPSITIEFQSAAMRYGHTMVTPGIFRRNAQCTFRTTSAATGAAGYIGLRTCNSYWNPQDAVLETDIGEILMGMASQIAEREDNIITEDLRGFVYGPLEGSRRDLMAINLQRGRETGLPDYNTARFLYGLDRVTTWSQINPDPNIYNALAQVYNNDINNVDIWTGGILESGPQGPGPLFRAIILEQFLRLRDGDRWWYANTFNNLFSSVEIFNIESTEFSTLLYRVGNVPLGAVQTDVFHHLAGDVCPQPKQLSQFDMENCTAPATYDYFYPSFVEYPFIVIAVGLVIIICATTVYMSIRLKRRTASGAKTQEIQIPADQVIDGEMVFGALILDKTLDVLGTVTIKIGKVNIEVMGRHNKMQREISLKKVEQLERSVSDNDILMVKIPAEYDLFLKFSTQMSRDRFLDTLMKACPGLSLSILSTDQIVNTMKTKEARTAEIQKFFGKFLEKFFNSKESASGMRKEPSFNDAKVGGLSFDEFAAIFEIPRDSLFVAQLFKLANKSQNGVLSPQEFFQLLALFSRKSPEDKMRFMFEIYDVEGSGRISRENFIAMFKSTLDLNKQDSLDVEEVVNSMFKEAGLDSKQDITFESFKALLGDYSDLFQLVNLGGNAKRRINKDKTRIFADTKPKKKELKRTTSVVVSDKAPRELTSTERFQRYIYDHRLEIFWLCLFYLTLLGISTERIYTYSLEREHRGLRRIAGYGISATRGAASGMMFSFSIVLVSLCRNISSLLRNTFLRKFIPFDAADIFHIICGATSLVIAAIHTTGHLVNFFSIVTEPTFSLACLFREITWPSSFLPKFSWWVFVVPTGITGYVVTVFCIILGVFSVKQFRTNFFLAFSIIHQTSAFCIYCLMLMHGWAALVQVPLFHTFLIGPLFLYMCDKLISIRIASRPVQVLKVEWLPSDVLMLQFEKPKGYNFKAGQWIRIASSAISSVTFHPFTLTSAPHEKHLSLHIRAVGPWTRRLKELYNPNFEKYPPLILDGPFGTASDSWQSYEHVVLIGAGIGVTPCASILKDFVHCTKSKDDFAVKKLIFFWICRSQKQFEWMVDLIKEAEVEDIHHRLEVHIFVTELNQKFDLRTIMLYIAEKQFYKLNGASLFTGLQAATHFGRPDFEDLFKQIQANIKTDFVAVFSCAPQNMLVDIEEACASVSRLAGAQFRNFDDSFY